MQWPKRPPVTVEGHHDTRDHLMSDPRSPKEVVPRTASAEPCRTVTCRPYRTWAANTKGNISKIGKLEQQSGPEQTGVKVGI